MFQSFHNENDGEEQVAHHQHDGGNGSGTTERLLPQKKLVKPQHETETIYLVDRQHDGGNGIGRKLFPRKKNRETTADDHETEI